MGGKRISGTQESDREVKLPKLRVVVHNSGDDRYIDVDDPRETIVGTLRDLGFDAEVFNPSP